MVLHTCTHTADGSGIVDASYTGDTVVRSYLYSAFLWNKSKCLQDALKDSLILIGEQLGL